MPKKAIFDKKNVLVIGGAGFIGSHLCDELIKTSKVICIDNFSTGDEKNIVHLFRIYGPRMKLNDGQMIPDFVNNAIDDKNLEVYGDNNFSSSFCYIDDCIDAVLKIMDSDINSPINIGSDIEVKLTDVAQKIITILESESKIEFIKEKFFVTPLCLPDIGMARTEIGWMPVVTLEQGLKKTIYELRASKGLKRT